MSFKFRIMILCFFFYMCSISESNNTTTWKDVKKSGNDIINTAKDNWKDLKEKIEINVKK